MAREYDLELEDKLVPLPNRGDGIVRFKTVKKDKYAKLFEEDVA
jgi:hypothetical protein